MLQISFAMIYILSGTCDRAPKVLLDAENKGCSLKNKRFTFYHTGQILYEIQSRRPVMSLEEVHKGKIFW